MFEYNNLNIVDRAVKIRGKYFRGLAVMANFTTQKGRGVRDTAE
jgi:hypothetical protein